MQEIVIKIDENLHTRLFDNGTDFYDTNDILAMAKAIRKGIVLPKGHGKLIDADVFERRLMNARAYYIGERADNFDLWFAAGLKSAAERLVDAPTIIEADRSEE